MSTVGSTPVAAELGGDDSMDEARNLCKHSVRSARLDMITQISGGVPDFAFDTFEENPPSITGAHDVNALRVNCTSVARLVTTFTETQESRLEDVRTGRLIRTVLHAEGGAVFCYTVVPGQSVVGFVFNRAKPGPVESLARHPLVNGADHAMTELIDSLRRVLGLPPQNAGGWSSEGREAPVSGRSTAELLSTAVSVTDLHYVARLRSGSAPEVVEKFDHTAMRQHFRLIGPMARRKFYDQFAGELFMAVGQVGRLIRSTVGGTVLRLVLDVEQGAVIYYRLGIGDYLVGVTLNQEQVGATDGKLATLAMMLAELVK